MTSATSGLLDRAEGNVVDRNGEYAGRGRLGIGWKNKETGLCHAEFQAVMGQVNQAARDAGLDGR